MAVLLTDYSKIEREACELFGLVWADATTVFLRQLQRHIGRRLEEKWEDVFSEGIMRVEKRTYRADYDASTAYSAGDQVYYAASGAYYQALKSTTGNAPATGDPLVTDTTYWADLKTSYSGNDYDASTAYVEADIVYYPDQDAYYQCHTASTGNAPTDTSYWGVLTQFDKYVAWEQTGETAIGQVRGVYDRNPRVDRGWKSCDFYRSENGIQVPGGPAVVWLDFQLRAPDLHGAPYDDTATYTANVDQVLFTESTGVTNFYDCIVNTSAGEDPEDTAASWSKVQIPAYFKSFLAYAAAADAAYMDRQFDVSRALHSMAERAWEREVQRASALQSQQPRFQVTV